MAKSGDRGRGLPPEFEAGIAARAELRRLVSLALFIIAQALEKDREESNVLRLFCNFANVWTDAFYADERLTFGNSTHNLALVATAEPEDERQHTEALITDYARARNAPSFAAFMAFPLWPEGVPIGQQAALQQVGGFLLACHPDWGVWVDWLKARYAGSYPDQMVEMERKRITDPEEALLPRVINRQFAELVKRSG